jgi:hypothetical protein
MMANEDRMNAACDLLMRQCTPVTYEKVVTHKIESIGGQKSSVARYFDHRRRCQNVKKEPLEIHIKRRSKVGKYQSSRQKVQRENATSGKSKNLVSLIVMHADHGVERCFGRFISRRHSHAVGYCPGGPAWPAWDAPCCPCCACESCHSST